MMITLGSDPEWFLTKDGKTPVSAIGKIGGTKKEPLAVAGLEKGFSLQEDNVTLEYNTPPTSSQSQFVDFQLKIQGHIKANLKAMKLKPLIQGSAVFPDSELEHPNAWVFGCEPDVCAWTGKPNPRPHSANMNLRSAGGHLHIGMPDRNYRRIEKALLVRVLDLFVGMPLMVIDPDFGRQQLYGKAGAFRFKPYGVEYRTPSNIWTVNAKRMETVANACNMAYGRFLEGYNVPRDVQVIMDAMDITGAKTLMEKHGINPIA